MPLALLRYDQRLSHRRRHVHVLAAVAALAFAGPASANGRFPAASHLVFDPLDGKHAALRTTFGLLRTSDLSNFRWVCEKALGYEGTYDPAIAIAGGAVLVALPDGIARSRDGECSWSRLPPPVAGKTIIDLAVDAADPAHVVAVTALAAGAPPGARASVFVSTDGGQSFGAALELPEDFGPLTIDVAGDRIYASGRAPFAALAMTVRSDDGGRTWSETTFDGGGGAPYLAAIDPTDRERVYLRTDGDTTDKLFFSADGARSFREILTAPELLGVAVSPDGARIAAGGPGDGVQIAGRDHLFAKVPSDAVRCLVWNAAGLFACGSEPFALARLDGATFTPLLRLADIEPLSCAAGSTAGDLCAPYWPEIARTLKPGAADAGADTSAPASPELPTAGGGGCTHAPHPAGSALPLLALVLTLFARRGISSVRPRLPCGRSVTAPPWLSASPSRSSS